MRLSPLALGRACRVTGSAMPALLMLLLAGNRAPAQAQTVVPVHEEPRHHLVLDRLPIRMLDVQIQPGDTTLYHTHSSAIVYVTIGVSTTNQQTLGGEWGNVNPANPPRGRPGQLQVVTSYAEQPLSHRVTNVGTSLFRLIGITNYGPGVQGNTAAVGEAVPGTVEVETPWHRAWRHLLAPGEVSPPHTTSTPIVAVQVTPGAMEVRPTGGEVQRFTEPGRWFFGEAGTEYVIRNAGSEPLEVVLVQVR